MDPLTSTKRFEYRTAPNERADKKLETRLMTEIADAVASAQRQDRRPATTHWPRRGAGTRS
jgi:hypothetical protein